MKIIYILIILSVFCFGCAPKVDIQECRQLSNSSNDGIQSPAKALEANGLSNLYKVSDDVYRSAQPEEGGMTSAKALGIKTVLSLRETELDTDLNHNENAGLNTIHLPIVTWDVEDKNIIDALRIIRDAPKPILIHCRHGSDRTGLIIAMYRIVFEGWSKSCAKAELMHGGFGYHSMWSNIPKEIDDADIPAIRKELGIEAAGGLQDKAN
ncbi:MAG: tyrosine-protein phosphatase [Proteobacteria bacterium]|nr:tyrosine-protein phosphatase [Pseudomonadota bacterium]